MNFSKIYQNVVLTLILVCLVVLIFQNQSRPLSIYSTTNSHTNPNFPTIPVNYSPTHFNSNSNNFAIIPTNKNGTIDVNVREVSDVIDVNIEDISTYDKLNVHLKSTDSYSLRSAGPLEVEID